MLSGLSPQVARALRLEVFYDGLLQSSISMPILDFFGLPHGRCIEYYSVLTAGYHESYLHATFRRENPTTLRRGFVIAEGLKGPGRFLGSSLGIRVLDKGGWYGEGEVKIYRDGDERFPSYCGTGLEDYVGSAYGLGRHSGYYAGSPLQVPALILAADAATNPAFVSFCRCHLPDPIKFAEELRVTIQQIGGPEPFNKNEEAAFEAYKREHLPAGPGWISAPLKDFLGIGSIVERRDDYCATAFVYCRYPQAVPRYLTELAVSDLGLLPSETKSSPDSFSEEEREQLMKALEKYENG